MIISQYSTIPIYSDLLGTYSTSDFQKNYNNIENRISFNCKSILLKIIQQFGGNIKEDSFEHDHKRYNYVAAVDNINPRILKVDIYERLGYFNNETRIPITRKIEECIGRIWSIQVNCPERLLRYADELITKLVQHIKNAYQMLEHMFYECFENDYLVCHINNLVKEILLESTQQETLPLNFWTGFTDVTGNSNKSKFWRYFFSRHSIQNIFKVLKSNQVDRYSPFDLYLRLANSGAKDLMLNQLTENNWFFSKAIKDIKDEEYSDDVKEAESSLFFRQEMPDNIGYATSYLYENKYFHIHITYPRVFEDDFLNALRSTRVYITESIDNFLRIRKPNIKIYSINSMNEYIASNNSLQDVGFLDYYAGRF